MLKFSFLFQVMGLTLDMDHQSVYWIVRGSDGSKLFRAPMAGSLLFGKEPPTEIITSLQRPNMKGPLCYFNNRLIWLQDDKNAVISDLQGANIASINGKNLLGLNMVYVMDPSLHRMPSKFHFIFANFFFLLSLNCKHGKSLS